jgi:hypothetical protein
MTTLHGGDSLLLDEWLTRHCAITDGPTFTSPPEEVVRNFAYPRTSRSLLFSNHADLPFAVYWREFLCAAQAHAKEEKTVVPAIVILIILAAAGGAWLGYRAGYRRGWQARDVRDAQDGQS